MTPNGKAKQNIDITTQGEKVTVPTIIFTKENNNNEKNND